MQIAYRSKQIVAGLGATMLLAAPAMASDPTDGMISTASALTQEYDLPAGLLLAVAEVESDFNPDCKTGKCHGLMQIHSSYASEYATLAGLDEYDLFDYRDSMRIAAAMLADYIYRYEGDLHMALMCYNLGEWGARAKRKDGVQTTSYSRKVVDKIEKWGFVELLEVEEESMKVEEAAPEVEEAHNAFVTGLHRWLREVLVK